jgi:diguanylate cyclase (GGDEF)-like protein
LLLWVGYGFLDTPLGTPCLIVLILARALFPGRVLLPALALGGGLLLGLAALSAYGVLHASPLLVKPVFTGARLSGWWATWLSVVFNAGAWPLAVMAVYVFHRLSRHQRDLEAMAHTDGLTGLPNRRKFLAQLDLESHRHRRNGQPLSVIMLDLDGFKRVNDNHGHDAGDVVLARLGGLIREGLRQQVDVAARMAGDEFAVLLPQTDLQGAEYVARKLMEALRRTAFTWQGQSVHLTLSAGVACTTQGGGGEALRQADDNLYVAKRTGRDSLAAAMVSP